MIGFDLPQNFTQNPESLLRRVRPRAVPPQIILSTIEPVTIAPSTSNAMAKRVRSHVVPPQISLLPLLTTFSLDPRSTLEGRIYFRDQNGSYHDGTCGKANEGVTANLQ